MDVASVIPMGSEGDEKIIVSVTTTAYSNNISRTAIPEYYITGFTSGWCKSSGLVGVANKFQLDASHNTLKIKMDATVSGTDGSGYYDIILNYEATPLAGETVAVDMENKIRTLGDSLETADIGFRLAYKCATVEYINGKFWIISGSLSNDYTGAYRSSVKVLPGDTNDASAILGFDLTVDSERIAGISVREVSLNSPYTAGTTPLQVNSGIGASAGLCFMITDGTYTDYFTALSGTTDTNIVVATTGTNSYDGIANSYATSGTKVQLLTEQDPDVKPSPYYESVDDVLRQGIKRMIKQIDYSS